MGTDVIGVGVTSLTLDKPHSQTLHKETHVTERNRLSCQPATSLLACFWRWSYQRIDIVSHCIRDRKISSTY